MARKSTNSNKSKKKENGDSLPDSDDITEAALDAGEIKDEPVVIEGEAEDVTDKAVGEIEAADTDSDADQDDQSIEDVGSETDVPPNDEVDAPKEENASDEIEIVAADNQPAPVAPPVAGEPQQSSFVPLIIGGLVAGAIGYGASHFGLLSQEQVAEIDSSALDAQISELSAGVSELNAEYDGLANAVAAISPTDTAPLSERLDALSSDVTPLTERLDALSSNVAALQNMPTENGEAPTAALVERIEALETDITGEMASLNERLTGLEDRLSDMQMAAEAAPDPTAGMSDEQLSAFQSELEQLTAEATAQVEQATAEVNAAKERASEFEQQAAEAAALAERQAAVAALTAAVESGAGFSDELAFFDDPPKALTATSENGVPTLSALQRAFPDVARSALATATVVPQDASATDRLTAFLKRQTNARSLAPKEGDSVDAILSRAEAGVSDGDLPGALDELSTLPDEAKEVLGVWIADAQARLAAQAALTEISAAEN